MISSSLSSENGNRTAGALVWENLRRYWIVALVAGLGYFLCAILPILLNYRSFDMMAEYVRSTLKGENGFVLCIDVVLAVVTSVSLQSYMHRTDACITVHSMPAKRSQLFGATMVSGVVLMLLPIVITAVLMLACRGATAAPEATNEVNLFMVYNSEVRVNGADVITMLACGEWIVKNLVVCWCTFAVSALAGVLTGTRAIHVLTALFLNALPGIVIFMGNAYGSTFLKGYPVDYSNWMKLMVRTSPVLYCGSSETMWGSHAAGYVIFGLVGILIAVLTLLIYRRVRLEREGDATVFPLMGDFLCIAVSFVCMSSFSLLVSLLSVPENFNRMFLLYAVVSGTVSFLIFRMVADSTTHIIKLRNLGKFALYAALVAVVFAFTVFDVQGYGKLVPAAADVEKVEVWQDTLFLEPAQFTEAEQVEAVREMQQAAMKQKKTGDEALVDASITYTLKSGRKIVRQYDLGEKAQASLASLRSTKPYLQAQQYHLTGSGRDVKVNGRYPVINLTEITLDEGATNIRARDIPAVIQALNQDMAGMDYKYLFGEKTDGELCYMSVELYEDAKHRGDSLTQRPDYCIDRHWGATGKVLKDLGYMDELAKSGK